MRKRAASPQAPSGGRSLWNPMTTVRAVVSTASGPVISQTSSGERRVPRSTLAKRHLTWIAARSAKSGPVVAIVGGGIALLAGLFRRLGDICHCLFGRIVVGGL